MLAGRVIPVGPEQCDRAANSMMFQDQFETLAWIHSLVKGDLNHPIELLTAMNFFNCRGNRRRIAESLEICPRAYNVAFRQKQLTRLARGFIESFLIAGQLVAGKMDGRFTLDQRKPQAVPGLDHPRAKQQAIILRFERRACQKLERRRWTIGLKSLLQPFESGAFHPGGMLSESRPCCGLLRV